MIKANICKIVNSKDDKCFVLHTDVGTDLNRLLQTYLEQTKTHSLNALFELLTEHEPTDYNVEIVKEVVADNWDDVRKETYKIADEIESCVNNTTNHNKRAEEADAKLKARATELVECSCGASVQRYGMSKHLKSHRHKKRSMGDEDEEQQNR